jgi:hypothetical protein
MSDNQKPTIELDQNELLTLYGSNLSDLLGLKCGSDPKSALGLKGDIKFKPYQLSIKVGPKV